jgi:hypothetical protein
MIHEGAKAAAFCDDLVNNPERRNELKVHPFADDLVDCEHWGVIGGAHAVERSDYDELRRENIDGGDVIYICDNDDPGMEAVKKFSFKYGKRMYAVRFGEKWPPGWDLADPVPRDLINDYGRTDKSLMDMLDPATWATKPVGKSHVLKDDFASEWAHTIDPEMYIWKRDPRRVFSDRGFNNLIAPFTQGNKKPCDLLKEHSFGGKIGTVERNPGRRTGLHHNDEGKTCFNLHVAKRHRPYAAGENPDLSPWENLLKQLFPLPSDLWLTKCFLATLIARPGIKMKYGLLLVSAVQGVGKTTLGMALDRVLGSWNVTWPDEDEIVDKQWTYWLDGALVFVNEIYSGHSAKAYNKLRSVITDKIIRVVKKFIGNCNMENHIHVIACSNSTRALKLDNTDRRWLVPKVTDKKWPSDEATRFYKWLYNEEGDRAIYYWAEKFLKDNPDAVVAEGAEAPPTSAKAEMMRDQYSPGMEVLDAKFAFIKDAYAGDVMLPACTQKRINERKNGKINGEPLPLLEVERVIELAERGEHFVMLANEGCEAIKRLLYNGRHSDKLESLHTVCNVASNAGFCVGKERIKSGPLKYRSRQGRIISLCPKLAAMVGSELANVPIIDLAQLAVELEPPPAF